MEGLEFIQKYSINNILVPLKVAQYLHGDLSIVPQEVHTILQKLGGDHGDCLIVFHDLKNGTELYKNSPTSAGLYARWELERQILFEKSKFPLFALKYKSKKMFMNQVFYEMSFIFNPQIMFKTGVIKPEYYTMLLALYFKFSKPSKKTPLADPCTTDIPDEKYMHYADSATSVWNFLEFLDNDYVIRKLSKNVKTNNFKQSTLFSWFLEWSGVVLHKKFTKLLFDLVCQKQNFENKILNLQVTKKVKVDPAPDE